VLKALQDNFTPYIFSSFCGWLQFGGYESSDRMAEREQDLGLSCNAFNTYRALQNLEALKAGQGELLKALQANIIPTYS
jgi:hypothetical protein